MNAAAALFVAGKVKSMADGWELAREKPLIPAKSQAKLAQLASP